MPTARTLNAANLEALGAARLATLLLEISAGEPAIKRRLRLLLAGSAGTAEAAREVAKRLASIARSRTFLDGPRLRIAAAELEAQRKAILDFVAPAAPREAFDLLWRLVACGGPVFDRSDDSNGVLSAVFDTALDALGPLAQTARLDPQDLAARACAVLRSDMHGVWNDLVAVLAPQMGAAGLGQLKALVKAWQNEPVVVPPKNQRQVLGWSSVSGEIYADQLEGTHRRHATQAILKQIADATGDVGAYIAAVDTASRKWPREAAEIARRLLAAGRPQDAWDALQVARDGLRDVTRQEWDAAQIDTLDALGRHEEAQASRWERFAEMLDPAYLRAYLARLPDFEDFDAEQRGLSHVAASGKTHQALHFLIEWPDLARASQLVLASTEGLNGNFYEVLSEAADLLGDKFPLAATLALRAMIDFTLRMARATRYRHAARHFRECGRLAERIEDFAGNAGHAAYETALRAAHGRKAAFWDEVAAAK